MIVIWSRGIDTRDDDEHHVRMMMVVAVVVVAVVVASYSVRASFVILK
jgi:hypothetical protein